MSVDPVTNFAKCTVSTGYDASATTIVLSAGEGAKLPATGTNLAFNLVWWNSTDYNDPSDDPNREIVRCTARSTDTLTVTRAQESTSATTKNTSAKTYKMALCLTKAVYDGMLKGFKVGTISRADISVTGTQAVTGVGFQPRLVLLFATSSAAAMASWGFSDGTDHRTIYNAHASTANTFSYSAANALLLVTGSSTYANAHVSSLDADGFTLTWAKTGSPTGAATIFYLAFA